ncbi:MAG: fasciclin domain-containing protein [Deltaproteobacteria bacterium]|nr:fasciclin domain-containing protein [Deltaproteobacteria bacterium]
MRKTSHTLKLLIAMGSLLAATGCSDDASVANKDQSIAQIAAGDPQFSILTAALTKAGLVETLAGNGPFTVFAPDNQAFAAAGITSLDSFSVDQLKQILLYHVVPARVMAKDVQAGTVLSAADLTLFVGTQSGVSLNGGSGVTGGAAVVTTDIEARNGVIHIIDRVLLPPDIVGCATYGNLTGLSGAVAAAAQLSDGTPVLDALKGPGPYTVFAPTNEAFAALNATPSAEQLRDVLLYHVVAGATASSAIPALAPSLLTNRWDNPLSLLFDTQAGVKVNAANVKIADIKCTNGIVHAIDKVLLPPNVVEMARIANLSGLLNAVSQAADLNGTAIADALSADEPYTIFAPTTAAFEAISAPSDTAVLRDVLLLHVVKAAAPVTSSNLPAAPVDTLLAQKQLTFDTTGPTVSSPGTNGAKIGPADIHVTNGVIHLIDKVLLP